MIYLAHSKKEDIPAQEYSEHINGVYVLASGYAQDSARYSEYDRDLLLQAVEKAAAYHDLGKLNMQNQSVLCGKVSAKSLPRNHVDAGAAYLLNNKHLSAISAAAIQAHHLGFPDFTCEINKGEACFRDSSVADDVDSELPELVAIHDKLFKQRFDYGTEEIKGDRSVYFRMMLSCLADADHTNTSIHYKKYPADTQIIALRPVERLMQLDRQISEMDQNSNDERNDLRNEMYYACRTADIDSSISSCDSPVGSGKTTAVMAHLLAQAEKRGLRRIFVVLPFTNIIDQSVKIYRKTLVLPGEKADEVVAELHHRADYENADSRHLTALWRAPIIVTTAVAFFETLASNSPSTLRRLHEFPGSAVFVDESHAALPAVLLPLAWKWINIYAHEWNCYWVLASGSLTRFWEITEVCGSGKSCSIPEIIGDELRTRLQVYEKRRITYKNDLNPKDMKELAFWITGFPGPRLVIMNTIQSAAAFAACLAEKFGRRSVEHISTALISNDRDMTLVRVKNRLKNPEETDWTLVATSCVEAGVNFSFKNGFRELCSLVSLLQASGRVNREGKSSDSEMWTFCISEDGHLKLNPGIKQSAEILKTFIISKKTIAPELCTQSISDEIKLYGLSGKYGKLISDEELLNFCKVEENFRVIDTDTGLVVVDQDAADRLTHGKINWQELQRISVQIDKYKLSLLRTPEIKENIYRWNHEYDGFLGYMAGLV